LFLKTKKRIQRKLIWKKCETSNMIRQTASENLNFNSHEWDTKYHLILNAIEKQTAQHLGARDKKRKTGIFFVIIKNH
jgi:hypothetical protein